MFRTIIRVLPFGPCWLICFFFGLLGSLLGTVTSKLIDEGFDGGVIRYSVHDEGKDSNTGGNKSDPLTDAPAAKPDLLAFPEQGTRIVGFKVIVFLSRQRTSAFCHSG